MNVNVSRPFKKFAIKIRDLDYSDTPAKVTNAVDNVGGCDFESFRSERLVSANSRGRCGPPVTVPSRTC